MLLVNKKFVCMCRYYRLANNMTQVQLASACNISRNTVSEIECGHWLPSSLLAFNLCKALDVKFEDLFKEVEV